MAINVLFFAHLRDLAGMNAVELEIGDAQSARDLLTLMRGRVPDALIDALADESAMVSINQRYAGWGGVINDGDEIGILPPVSGG